jgi:hypothetical protein
VTKSFTIDEKMDVQQHISKMNPYIKCLWGFVGIFVGEGKRGKRKEGNTSPYLFKIIFCVIHFKIDS